MISGPKTLQYLDQGLSSARKDINRIDRELNQVSQTLHGNLRMQTHALKVLASIRLDELSRGSFLGDLELADQRALDMLEKREQAYEALETNINLSTESLEAEEKKREAAMLELNINAQKVIDCEQQLQAQLEEDAEYQEQFLASTHADSVAIEAEDKAQQAEKDRQTKGEEFENNKLFMYLWKRKYDTSEYKANTLTRFLDAWVERHCKYKHYRVNYWTLLEIPKRLRTHAEKVRTDANESLERLTAFELVKAKEAGLPDIQKAHSAAQDEVDGIDDSIEQHEERLSEFLKQRTQFAEAKDTYMQQSLQMLMAALGNKDSYDLRDSAHQTRSKEDDRAVRELDELRDKHQDLQEELSDHRNLHDTKLKRLKEIEGLRRNFKNKRFDGIRSSFGNESLISSMMSQFLNGLVSSNELWRVLKRHQRHRDVGAWPDFGSGGLGLPRTRNTPWHLPTRRGGRGGGFRLPKSGGWSSRGRGGGGGGGFRTGGGF